MHARVSTIQGAPGKVDDVARQTQEQTLPQLQKMEGFKGFVALADRQSGKMLGVSFWESEEALRATEQAVSSVRSEAAEAAGGVAPTGGGRRRRRAALAGGGAGGALGAAEQAVSSVRSEAAETADGIVASVEEYEV